MRRGTTPILKFQINTDLDLTELEVCYVTIQQINDEREKTFDMSSLTIDTDENIIECQLSQDDTLFFNGMVDIQIRFKMQDGYAYASDIQTVKIEDVLMEGEI